MKGSSLSNTKVVKDVPDDVVGIVVQKLKRWFDFFPIHVSEPQPVFADKADGQRYFRGYVIDVSYKYRGKMSKLFENDENFYGSNSKEHAWFRAMSYFKSINSMKRNR